LQVSVPVTWPQFLPTREQKAVSLSAMQPHTFAAPAPPHVCGAVHVPHELTVRICPQLSMFMTWPQSLPKRVQKAVSLSAVQPHTFAVPAPPHVCGEAQRPHDATVRGFPQLSVFVTWPQFLPRRKQRAGSLSATQLVESPAASATPSLPD
jgi:hypothetical protein